MPCADIWRPLASDEEVNLDIPQRVVHEVLYEWFEPKDPLSALTMSRPGRSLIGNVSTTASWFVTPTGPSW
jgi:hypothetical protein